MQIIKSFLVVLTILCTLFIPLVIPQTSAISQNSNSQELVSVKLAGESSPDEESDQEKRLYGKIAGQVIDKNTSQPLIGSNVVVVGKGIGAATNSNGDYIIDRLLPGEYLLEFSYIGYKTREIQAVEINSENTIFLNVELEPEDLRLNEIIVTPGQFSVMGNEPTVRQTLTKKDLQTIPFGEDIYRAITRLPGVSSNDFSAKFTVRGGKNEEVLVLMDGQELYEPFHLKDVDGGILSIIDVEAIKGIDLFTGGYPAEYGEAMSGVFNMKSSGRGTGKSRTTLGVSLMNARLMSEGNFNQNKGSWLFSARRGYLDVVLKLMEEEDPPQPFYYDLFGKFQYQISERNGLSASILHSQDKLEFVEDDQDEANTTYGNSYGWITLNSMVSRRLFIRTIASFGRIAHTREGIGYFDDLRDRNFTVNDENWVNMIGLKQDLDYELHDRWYLKGGYYINFQSANYDYFSTTARREMTDPNNYILIIDSTVANLNPEGERYGGYISSRFRIMPPLTLEAGIRYDHNAFSSDSYLSPRLNIVYALGRQTFLRGGWGYFNQSQRTHEIKVAYGETDFFPAQRSEHWVAGLEHTSHNGLNLRLETYFKNISDLRPDYRRLSNSIELFPEIEEDVFALTFNGAKSRGIELYVKYDKGRKISFWSSYALAFADEDVQNLQYRGETFTLEDPVIPNRYDQRHTFYTDINYRPNRHWQLNISWQYHTGWPYNPLTLQSRQLPDGSTEYYLEAKSLYGAKFPAYHRLDVQLNRNFYLDRSRISLFLAIINLYNRDNVRNIKFNWRTSPDGTPYLEEVEEYWFPLLPSIGISLSWDH